MSVIVSFAASFFASTSILMRAISVVIDLRVESCLSIASHVPASKTTFVFAIVMSSCIILISRFSTVGSILTLGNSEDKLYLQIWSYVRLLQKIVALPEVPRFVNFAPLTRDCNLNNSLSISKLD